MASQEPSRTSRPLLAVDAIESGYGRVKVLHGISLEVLPGEIVCLIGPNGAGKTTLLRTISGLNRPTRGTIRFKGEEVAGLKPHQMVRRGIGHCPEGRRVFQLSVEENLITGYIPGRGKSFAELRDEVYGLFPILGERRHQSAGRLSGGQQQMVAIGRALMSNPRILLCDEISLGLAPVVIRDIYAAFPKIRAGGASIVVVEQDIGQALAVADRVYCLMEGRVTLTGTPSSLTRDAIHAAYFGAHTT